MTKPPYRVPSMREINALPWNGYSVVSTFSGCGGSCLGFKMAGYKILWANEFIPAAQDTYRTNHPTTYLNTQDIRTITARDIRAVIGDIDIDVLEGSPPCASFSTAGKREKGWGKVKAYSDTKQRTDDLFFEYARLLKDLQPKVFVAENVSGLVKGTAKGYFLEILQALKACGYRVEAKLLDAQWLGVPQMRQRIIFVGVRNDLDKAPAFPKPLGYQYTLGNAICDFDPQVELATSIEGYAIGTEAKRLAAGQKSDKYQSLIRASFERPCPTVTVSLGSGYGPNGEKSAATVIHPIELRRFSIAEAKRICAFPDDFTLTGSYDKQWERLGRAVPPVMMSHVARVIRDEILCTMK